MWSANPPRCSTRNGGYAMTLAHCNVRSSGSAFRCFCGGMILLFCGCASGNNISVPTSFEHGLSLAVWLEDQCESKGADEQSVTLLEALHDGLIFPAEMLMAIATMTVVSTVWSLYDRVTLLAGELLPNRPQMVLEYLKPHRAGPELKNKGKVSDAESEVVWLGCLTASGDG
jgi:hypothetical protein